ncbi:hypothetical protein VTJ04DRAFT_4230 [Mycothermus thermophilus]|uniref:uncharacterized protein n=1 Tax=Humicola insolens TaxID=85995 RepID=UPI0037438CC7
MGQTCSYILVQPGDSCASLAARCGITGAQFTEFNPSPTLCSTLQPRQPVCCSSGSLPDLTPKPNADGTCATHNVVPGDSCWDIADKNYITMDDIERFNSRTWGWEGCSSLKPGPICISTGEPPMPEPVEGTVCGPQVPGTKRPSSWDQISSLNPCPLNACCNKWGQCGITPEFCTPSNSSTGAPGTSAPGENGCISNCGTQIVTNGAPGGNIRIGYFEAFGVDRACLTMDASHIPSGYTHMHYAFGDITHDYQVDVSRYQTQWEIFTSMRGFKRILSFGGWSFSTELDTAPIFKEGVTAANRLKFAQSVVDTIKRYNLDGVDFDWEYPGAQDIPGLPPGHPNEGRNYLEFLRLVRSLLPPGVSLSIAAPASYWYLKGFPIAEMAEVLDYIVYMTYDLHGRWDYDSPHANPGCPTGNCLRSHVNLTETELALAMITKAGVPANKIVVGTAGYGRSFKMVDPNCTGPNCRFTGPNSTADEGPCTRTAGYIAQAELEALMSGGAATSHLARRGPVLTWHDDDSDSDIMVYGNGTWVSYMSAATKASRISRYANYGFAGTVEWAVDLEQFVFGPNDHALSVTQMESEFLNALKDSEYDTSQFEIYNFTDLATRLTDWKGCDGKQRDNIYSGWQQSWNIMNVIYSETKNGIDLNSAAALEFLGPPAVTSKRKAQFEDIFKTQATIQPGYITLPPDWRLAVRCDDPLNECRDGTVAYTIPKDPDVNRYSITFCKPYFKQEKLNTLIKRYAKNKNGYSMKTWANIDKYMSQGHTWYHELMHVEWAVNASPRGRPTGIWPIVDVTMVFNPRTPKQDFVQVYGGYNAKALARWYSRPLKDNPFTIVNSDSLTLYAMAKYVQKELGGIYPHLPLAGNPPDDVFTVFTVPGYFSVDGNGTATLESGKDWEYPTTCSEDGVCSDVSLKGGDRTDGNAIVTATAGDWATRSMYPDDYLSSYSSWAGLTPTATPVPLARGPIHCFNEADFPGHADIQPDKQDDYSVEFSGLGDIWIGPGDPPLKLRKTDRYGVNYDYRVEWVSGCVTSVDKQNFRFPLGMTESTITAYLLVRESYTKCNNGGVGGWCQVGCLRYTFEGGRG